MSSRVAHAARHQIDGENPRDRGERLSYRPRQGVLHYRVRSDRDIRDRRGVTSLDFDAASGALQAVYVPTGRHAGDTATTWLMALHMADIGGQAMKLWVCVVGWPPAC